MILLIKVVDGKWWKMTEAQRKAHIKKFNSQIVRSTKEEASLIYDDVPVCDTPLLSISLNNAAKQLDLPYTVLSGIWQKAHTLLSDPTLISNIPGGSSKDKFVFSRSGNAPHLVKWINQSLSYKCGDNCMNYKAINICSHTVATSQRNDDLEAFLTSYVAHNKKKPINLFQASKYDMPAGAGSKGGKPKRCRSNKRGSETVVDNNPSTSGSYGTPSQHNNPSTSGSYGTPSQYDNPSGSYTPSQYNNPSNSGYHSRSVSSYNTSPAIFPVPPTPFCLAFIKGNISVCQGCKQKFPRNPDGSVINPPYNIVVRHVLSNYLIHPIFNQREVMHITISISHVSTPTGLPLLEKIFS